MSIDLNWETLTGGPDGADLAESIRDFIHTKFQSVPLPRFIKSVTVHDFEFGQIPPDVVLKDICDPLPDFYEENEELDEADSDEGDEPVASGDAYSGHTSYDDVPDALRAAERRRREEQQYRKMAAVGAHQDQASRPITPATAEFPFPPQMHGAGLRNVPATPDRGTPFLGLGASTPGIPGGASNMHYLQSKIAGTGWSGTQTPLAAVAGAKHLTKQGWLDAARASRPQSPSPLGRDGSVAYRESEHHRNPSQSSISTADFGPIPPPFSPSSLHPPFHPLLREKHSVSTLAATSTGTSRPPTRDAFTGTGSAVVDDYEDDMKRTAHDQAAAEDHHRFREPRVEDMQAVFRIRYAGDVKLMLTAEILLDYPMPSFVGIPVKLNITGLTFDGVGVMAHIRKRVHFCFLGPEDALAAVGSDDDQDDDEEEQGGATRASGSGPGSRQPGKGKEKKGGRMGGLLQEIQVESEIGQREGTKQSLKNVGKVERFVLEQVRRIFEEEFVYPSFWTFLV